MRVSLFILLITLFCWGCKQQAENTEMGTEAVKLRHARGYAQYDWQMDSVYNRLQIKDVANDLQWKAAISPHDNYRFAGKLYYESLRGINAPNIILIGVAHSARNYELQDKLVFGTFTAWESPYGKINVSSLNAEIMSKLPANDFIVHDSMQVIEHSLEAIIPFLHKRIEPLKLCLYWFLISVMLVLIPSAITWRRLCIKLWKRSIGCMGKTWPLLFPMMRYIMEI
ncbi:MAG: AmmeMemoRadiSam system protein B [Flammeovirgaceae bacterium]|nr:AmmeMemoRadiSam system protein B [Flammeovirgaceae bacterium]